MAMAEGLKRDRMTERQNEPHEHDITRHCEMPIYLEQTESYLEHNIYLEQRVRTLAWPYLHKSCQ